MEHGNGTRVGRGRRGDTSGGAQRGGTATGEGIGELLQIFEVSVRENGGFQEERFAL